MTYPNDFNRCRGRENDPECFRCERFIVGIETMLQSRHTDPTARLPWIVAPVEKPCPLRVEKKAE